MTIVRRNGSKRARAVVVGTGALHSVGYENTGLAGPRLVLRFNDESFRQWAVQLAPHELQRVRGEIEQLKAVYQIDVLAERR